MLKEQYSPRARLCKSVASYKAHGWHASGGATGGRFSALRFRSMGEMTHPMSGAKSRIGHNYWPA